MAAAIRPDQLTPILAARLGPHDSVGRCVMDFLCNHRLSQVSHVFRDVNRESMVASARTMRDRDITSSLSLEQPVVAHAARTKLTVRFHAVCAQQHLNPVLPGAISPCFAALHESQRKEAEVLGQFALQLFNETSARYRESALLPMRFFHLEAALLNPLIDGRIDDSLCDLWRMIMHNAELPANSPPQDAGADDVRAWMNDPENAEALGQCRHTSNFLGVGTIPPEIGKLHSLENFKATGLYGLPEEMGALQALRSLDLRECSFRELPPLIGELHQLQTLSISGRFHDISPLEGLHDLASLRVQAPVHVLPEGIWRRCYRDSFRSLLSGFLNGKHIAYTRRITLGIPLENLTDIPFEAWFKLNVHLPYLPLYLSFSRWVRQTFGDRPPLPFDNYLRQLPPLFRAMGTVFVSVSSVVILLASAAAIGLIQIALNLSILLCNLFLRYAVEPLVFSLHDALDYPHMVHVRDLPAPVVPARPAE